MHGCSCHRHDQEPEFIQMARGKKPGASTRNYFDRRSNTALQNTADFSALPWMPETSAQGSGIDASSGLNLGRRHPDSSIPDPYDDVTFEFLLKIGPNHFHTRRWLVRVCFEAPVIRPLNITIWLIPAAAISRPLHPGADALGSTRTTGSGDLPHVRKATSAEESL